MTRGKLIAFEGIDGSGKSTQVALLAEALRAAGVGPVVTREPTDGRAGRAIRAMASSDAPVDADEELRLFLEDRREHVREVIEPALRDGRVVVTDRYYVSTVAYQGARSHDPAQLLAASEAEFPIPDLVLLFEIDPAEGLARVRRRGATVEGAFERDDFLMRVAENFRSLDRPYLARIDAAGTQEAVARRVAATVRARLDISLAG